MNAQQATFDVVMASDLRLPGGTVASMVEEVKALNRAGYSVGLIQVFSPLVARPRALNPAIRALIDDGAAQLVLPGDDVRARLAVLRHPAVFEEPQALLPTLTIDKVVLVANQAVQDRDGTVHYDVGRVNRYIRTWTTQEPVWAPIGPLVREGLHGQPVHLLPDDWMNVIDVDEWASPRDAFRDVVPVIGRHSRPQPAKWSANRAEILAAYPADGSVRVRILGGAEEPARILGEVPASWEVEEFGARPARNFLSDIDFFVYYPRATTVEAFGRTVMEAMASGAVAILDPRLEPSFGDAALYAAPQESIEIVKALYADPDSYQRQVARAREWVRERLGHERHVARIRALLGDPAAERRHVQSAAQEAPTVLYVSSNGAGMGHLTRLLAIARRSKRWSRPIFLSLSQAVPVVANDGFPYEYFPSRGALEIDTGTWNPMFEARFRQALDDHRPAAVIFDGTWPYLGLVRAREDYPHIRFIWSRRGMWKPTTPPDQLEKSRYFDLVFEPGEAAGDYDQGPTVDAPNTKRVGPITYLDREDLLSRDDARRELGIDAESMAVLVALGAGNINDISTTTGAVIGELRSRPGIEVLLTESPIARSGVANHPAVRTISTYPISRYFNAFDASVHAAGYNAFHECVAFGLPTMFVPNLSTRTDDQAARGRWAEEKGFGWCMREEDDLKRQMQPLLDRGATRQVRSRLQSLELTNGAREAAELVHQLIESKR